MNLAKLTALTIQYGDLLSLLKAKRRQNKQTTKQRCRTVAIIYLKSMLACATLPMSCSISRDEENVQGSYNTPQ